MAIAYQYDASGYFAGAVEDYGSPLPNNSTRTKPTERKGYIPRWTGTAWEKVENHQGEEGYVDGRPFTIKEYGPYPAGWSATPPEPTPEERAGQVRGRRDGLLSATDYLMMPDYPLAAEQQEALRTYRQALRDLSLQPGFPDAVIWPEEPALLR